MITRPLKITLALRQIVERKEVTLGKGLTPIDEATLEAFKSMMVGQVSDDTSPDIMENLASFLPEYFKDQGVEVWLKDILKDSTWEWYIEEDIQDMPSLAVCACACLMTIIKADYFMLDMADSDHEDIIAQVVRQTNVYYFG